MLCYKNRTFCPYYKTCYYGQVCSSALTPKIRVEAQQAKQALSQYISEPPCYIEGTTNDTGTERTYIEHDNN